MCYTRKEERDLENEARRIIESRLAEEEARHRREGHAGRRKNEGNSLTEKVRELVGAR